METPEQSLHTPEDGPNEMPLNSMENTSNTEIPQEPMPELEPNIAPPQEVPAHPEAQEFPLSETEIQEEPSTPEVPDANLIENNSNEQHTIVDQLVSAEEPETIAEIVPEIIENLPVSEIEIIEEPTTPEILEANLVENHTPENSDEQHTIVEQLIPAEESETITEIESTIIEISPASEIEHVEVAAILEEEEVNDDSNEELLPQVAFQELSRVELVAAIQEAVDNEDPSSMRMRVRSIRDGYYKVKDEEVAAKRLKFIENGGLPEEFEVLRDETDEQFDALVKRFQEKRADERRRKEQELLNNLKKKEGILAELKAMLENTENVSASFNRLHELQEQWRSIGLVPSAYVDELWRNYHHHTNNFYDIIKINNELRDLDHKKNLELKTLVCEKAEDLLMEESITKSLDDYKALQDQWKEIGHVAREFSETVWERFRAAGDKLFDRRREYIQSQEKDYTENLAKKNAIVAKAEEFLQLVPHKNHPQWQEASEKFAALLEEWKLVGFAARKDNEAVWQKFKDLRDQFYNAKEEYYKTLRDAQNHNYKLKVDLCMEAEAIRESNDWKKTGERLRQLQEAWKLVGPIAKKHSDKLWTRFRTACDAFFENRNKHFAGMNDEQDVNLEKKKELLSKIEAFLPSDDTLANFDALKAFQSEWMEIGHVPIKEKDKIYKAFREAIDAQFGKIKTDSANVRREQFRSQVSNTSNDKGGKDKLNHQRIVVQDKIKKLQSDVQTLENNIGFFGSSKSKAAEDMKRDIERKINKAKEEIGQLIDQLKILKEV